MGRLFFASVRQNLSIGSVVPCSLVSMCETA